MRLGSTSYVYPADILPNVERLAPLVDDVELVLFEVDDYGSNLPDAATAARLAELGAAQDLTYSVHLPLDLKLAADGSAADASLDKARRVIDATRGLPVSGYVVHLDGRDLEAGPTPAELARWRARAGRSLAVVAAHLGDPAQLCVENLERWDPEAYAPLVEALGVSRCTDLGHLWKMGWDPLEWLPRWLDRTRIVHLHGLARRDHQSLTHVPTAQLDPVVAYLVAHYAGVVTLEVFGEHDFFSSLAAWRAAVARTAAG